MAILNIFNSQPTAKVISYKLNHVLIVNGIIDSIYRQIQICIGYKIMQQTFISSPSNFEKLMYWVVYAIVRNHFLRIDNLTYFCFTEMAANDMQDVRYYTILQYMTFVMFQETISVMGIPRIFLSLSPFIKHLR